jgi:hypothetical protein
MILGPSKMEKYTSFAVVSSLADSSLRICSFNHNVWRFFGFEQFLWWLSKEILTDFQELSVNVNVNVARL